MNFNILDFFSMINMIFGHFSEISDAMPHQFFYKYFLWFHLKFIYSEKATKFWEIFTLLLSYVASVKGKVVILQTFVAFSEYMNFSSAHGGENSCSFFTKLALKKMEAVKGG